MVRLLLFTVLAVNFYIIGVLAETCTLKFNKAKPGLFTAKVDKNDIIQDPQKGFIKFDSSSGLDTYCSTGFRNYAAITTSKLVYQLKFTCSAGSLMYQTPEGTSMELANNDGNLLCEDEAQYYIQTVQYCKNTGLVYGFNVGNTTSISFAEICYDLKNYRAEFVHYVAGVRTKLVDNQFDFNPNNSTKSFPAFKSYTTDDKIFLEEYKNLPVALRMKAANYANLMTSRIANLIPVEQIAGIMEPYVSSFRNMGAIAWWSNLLDYNWRQLQYLIRDLSQVGWYEVYAGFSDEVALPSEGRNLSFTYEVSISPLQTLSRSIPLYVWNYVKKGDNKDSGVVIIGVNSPFFSNEAKEAVFCQDICDKISWMNPLKNTRKFATMGYIFCCHPQDVKTRLTGFPLI
ncbi:unnamed protein product [Hermetia illucens]|uniref:Uncharacterized protein n=1 Tax=Hermetia illucens TaxID=343691 RepID=A0A7R8YPE0_HERIL|nr:uncharacterized protein LOC119647121 [Hermetia illucens]CAD7079380.1 unnamed protein product [Hermetia illucens]